MEILHKQHSKKGLFVLAVLLLAAVIFFAGVNIGNKQAGSEGKSLTGYAIASLSGSQQTDLPIVVDAVVNELELPIQSDLEISTTGVAIKTDHSTIEINNENRVSLKEFRGKMYWNESQLTIDGKAKQYFGQNTNIDWTNVKKVKLDVLQGTIQVKEFDVKKLSMLPSGTVVINENILKIEEQELVLQDLAGSFNVSLNNSQVYLNMKGVADKVSAASDEYSIVVK